MVNISLSDNCSLSLSSLEEDVEDNIKEAGDCTFDEEISVNYTGDLEKINFKESSFENIIIYQRSWIYVYQLVWVTPWIF